MTPPIDGLIHRGARSRRAHRWVPSGLAALLVALLACAPALADPIDAGVGDRGFPPPEPLDAGSLPPDAEPDAEPDAAPVVSLDEQTPSDGLRAQIDALKSLVAGEPSGDMEIASLFDVDLLDVVAVEARVPALRRIVEVARRDLDPLVARRAAAIEGGGAGLSAEEVERHDRLTLLVTREGLRLAVLTRPVDERQGLLTSEAEMRLAARDALAAAQAQRKAEETARAAEAARQAALREVEQARSAAGRRLAEARAAYETVRGEIAAAQGALAKINSVRAEAAGRRAELSGRSRAALTRSGLEPSEADTLHDALVAELVDARTELQAALDALHAPIAAPELPPTLDLEMAAYRHLLVEAQAVAQSRDRVRSDRQAYIDAVTESNEAAVPTLAAEVRSLNALRLELLPRLSRARHEAVLGLGPQGLDQLRQELTHLRLMARCYTHERRHHLSDAPGWLADTLGRASTRWRLLFLLLLLCAAGPVTVRRRELVAWVDGHLVDWARESDLGAWVRRWWRPVRALAMPLLFYAFVHLFCSRLVMLLDVAETRLLSAIAGVLALYWLVIAATHYLLVQLASRPGTPVDDRLSARLLSTVRVAGRTVAVISIFLITAEAILGRGYLYTVVRQTAWIVAIPIVWFTFRRWQPDIFDAYFAMAPEGALAERIERVRGKRIGVFLALPLALWLMGRRLLQIIARGALRLEHVRRALSFLFLRRLEKQAGEGPEKSERTLDPELVETLVCRAVDATTRVERFPSLDAVLADLETWRDAAPGISWALVGDRGSGRTTWLETLSARCPERPVILTLPVLAPTPAALCGWMVDALGLGDVEPTVDGVVGALERGPSRLILLDDAQRCARRSPGGSAGFRALLDIVRRSHHTAWICSFSKFMWAWLMFSERAQDVFRGVAKLGSWSEEHVDALVRGRMAACGREVTYEDLMDRPDRVYEREEELERTRERYVRLLWDYAEGLPLLIQHFWSRSLSDPDPDAPLRVCLFEVPTPDELEVLLGDARFALHAVVLHGELELADAPIVMQTSATAALGLLEQLRALGCVERIDDRYVVPIHWYRAVVRFLRRKHLLAA